MMIVMMQPEDVVAMRERRNDLFAAAEVQLIVAPAVVAAGHD